VGSQQKVLLIICYIFAKGGQNKPIWLLMVLIRALTTVNNPKRPPNFHSTHENQPYPHISSLGSVNNQKHAGVGQAVNLNKFIC